MANAYIFPASVDGSGEKYPNFRGAPDERERIYMF